MTKYIVTVEIRSRDMWEIKADNEESAKNIVMDNYDKNLSATVTLPINRLFLDVVERI